MEDAAKADEPGADGAEPKKQYLLDRIATSDGFKDAKAHKEEDAPRRRPRPPRTPRPQRNLRPRIRRRRSADDPCSWTTSNP